MNIDTITQLISTLGFPIVCAAALFWYINKQEERHKDEMENMRTALNDNTTILSELKELIKTIAGIHNERE